MTIALIVLITAIVTYLIIGFCLRSYYVVGNEITQNKATPSVTSVDFRSVGKLTIAQSEDEKLVEHTRSRYLPRIKTEVRGSTLLVQEEQDVLYNLFAWALPKPTYNLEIKDLQNISIAGTGDIELGQLHTSNLTISGKGTGSLRGDLTISDKLDVDMAGTLTTTLRGSAKLQTLRASGNIKYNALDLKTDTSQIQASGNGHIDVYAEDSLKITLSGNAKVRYKGSPSVSQEVSGTGKLESIE